MTDLEITKLCAEAMGILVVRQLGAWRFPNTQFENSLYNPLHDGAQTMALLEECELQCEKVGDNWHVVREGGWYACNENLKRAACECAAKMQKDKK